MIETGCRFPRNAILYMMHMGVPHDGSDADSHHVRTLSYVLDSTRATQSLLMLFKEHGAWVFDSS